MSHHSSSRSLEVARLVSAVAIALFSVACSGPTTVDSGVDTGAVDTVTTDHPTVDAPADVVTCTTDLLCSDGIFCNGAERCAPGAANADSRGCVSASPATPCASGEMCNEGMQRCEMMTCGSNPDVDGDGHRSIACGGDDCDDNDANRFPGHPEVCAFDTTTMMRVDPTHDEDCDPSTFASPSGDGDRDGDGYADSACCNVDRNGMRMCGGDCADIAPVASVGTFMITVEPGAVHPMQVEVCNGVDDNCNGTVDEGLPSMLYRHDCDGDGFGDASDPGVMGCDPSVQPACMGHTSTTMTGDCDDAVTATHPGATEVCNGVDDNCTGGVDEGLTLPVWYRDADGDGFGAMSMSMAACSAPSGYVADATDCNDADPAVHALQMLYQDLDHDGYGTGPLQAACPGPDWAAMPGDCYDSASDPAAANAFPGQTAFFGTGFFGGTSTASGCSGITSLNGCFDYDCDNTVTHEPPAACTAGNTCNIFLRCAGGGSDTSGACGTTTAQVYCNGCSGGTCGGVSFIRPGMHTISCR